MGAQDDKVASSGHIKAGISAFAAAPPSGGTTSACFFKSGVPHSFFSRFDSPDQDKFWLTDLLQDATEFMTNAAVTSYPVGTSDSALVPYKNCHLTSP